MAAAPDKAPSLAALTKIGLCDFRVWAIEFDPPFGPRGVSVKHRPVKWKGAATHLDQGAPMIIAVRATAEEADRDCRQAFWDQFSKRPIPAAPAAAKKPPVKNGGDWEDLI